MYVTISYRHIGAKHTYHPFDEHTEHLIVDT
jgi:hypothetical protein